MLELFGLVSRLTGGVFVAVYMHAAATGGTPHLWMLIVGVLAVLISF